MTATTEPEVELVPQPPARGLAAPVSEHEARLADVLRAAPGSYAVLGVVRAHHQAEGLRRRVHRGRGAWVGGAASWSVVVRKTSYRGQLPEWRVYVAHRGPAAQAAGQ